MNLAEQARLLYILLDAADDEGRLRDSTVAEEWRALKARFDNSCCEREHASLAALLDELDRRGALAGTWIQNRWLAAKARNPGDPVWRREPRRGGGARQDEH